MKVKREKRPKRVLTYEEEHNLTFDRFKKTSRLIIWAGALNVISLLVSIIHYVSNTGELYFYFCFGMDDFFFQLLGNIPNFFTNYKVWFFVIIVLIAILTTAVAVLLGVFASQGKKKALFGSLIFYVINTGFILPCYYVGEQLVSIYLMSVLHVAIIGVIVLAIYQYYKIIAIAERHGVLKSKENGDD